MNQPQSTHTTIPCNCRNNTQCPLQGSCNTQSVIYKATVTTPRLDTKKTYIGLTEGPWKQRYSQHKSSFNNRKYEQNTTLSKFIWNENDRQEQNQQFLGPFQSPSQPITTSANDAYFALQKSSPLSHSKTRHNS